MSMSDPPRSDTAKTIAEAQELGVGIKMLTGDAVAIGKELAKQLHLGTNIFDSQKLIGGCVHRVCQFTLSVVLNIALCFGA